MTPEKYKPFDAIPEEILMLILSKSKGNAQVLAKLALVCHQWHRVTNDDSLWQGILKKCKAKTIPINT